MTNDEILNLQPGRDLDIKVALTVMDYMWLKHLLQFSAELAVKWLGTTADIEQSGGVYVLVPDSQFVGLKERENFAEAVPCFSTEIEAAEQVIKHMQELGYEYSLETKTVDNDKEHYVSFHKIENVPVGEARGFVTVSEGISKVALQVILGIK